MFVFGKDRRSAHSVPRSALASLVLIAIAIAIVTANATEVRAGSALRQILVGEWHRSGMDHQFVEQIVFDPKPLPSGAPGAIEDVYEVIFRQPPTDGDLQKLVRAPRAQKIVSVKIENASKLKDLQPLGQLKRLRMLWLNRSALRDGDFAAVKGLPLERIVINEAVNLKGNFVDHLNPDTVRILDISNTRGLDARLFRLDRNISNVNTMSLYNSPLDDASLVALAKAPTLTFLHLGGSKKATVNGLKAFLNRPVPLQSLDWGIRTITLAEAQVLAQLDVSNLSLAYDQGVTPEILETLSKCKNMKRLVLENCPNLPPPNHPIWAKFTDVEVVK